MNASVCPNCERPSCKHFLGGRSEAAYQDCIAHTAERANQMREAVHKAGNNGEWAAVWAWLDKHQDQTVKQISDANGRLEIELAVAKRQLAATERDLNRMLKEGL